MFTCKGLFIFPLGTKIDSNILNWPVLPHVGTFHGASTRGSRSQMDLHYRPTLIQFPSDRGSSDCNSRPSLCPDVWSEFYRQLKVVRVLLCCVSPLRHQPRPTRLSTAPGGLSCYCLVYRSFGLWWRKVHAEPAEGGNSAAHRSRVDTWLPPPVLAHSAEDSNPVKCPLQD